MFDRTAEASGMEIVQIPFPPPRADAVFERFLGRLRREFPDHPLIFNNYRLSRLLKEYVS